MGNPCPPGNGRINPEHNSKVGELKETSLHASLKTWYTREGDQQEVSFDGFVVDIVRGDLLIEIQTRNFSAIRPKLVRLVEQSAVHLVYPIPQQKWIVRQTGDNRTPLKRRKSPKHGRIEDLFTELVRLPQLISHPNFTLEVLFTHEEEIWRDDGRGSWRRKGWSIADRRLLAVVGSQGFASPADFCALLPASLPQPFDTQDLARSLNLPRGLAQKMTFCLRGMGALQMNGKRGRAWLYLPTETCSNIPSRPGFL